MADQHMGQRSGRVDHRPDGIHHPCRMELGIDTLQRPDQAGLHFVLKEILGRETPAETLPDQHADVFQLIRGPDIRTEQPSAALKVQPGGTEVVDLPLGLELGRGQGAGAGCQRMMRRRVWPKLDLPERAAFEPGRDRVRQPDGKVDIALAQVVPQRAERAGEELQLGLGMGAAEQAERLVQQGLGKQHVAGDADTGFLAALQRRGLCGKAAGVFDDRLRLHVKRAAPPGQRHAAGLAIEQRETAMGLQLRHRIADRRDGPAHFARGGRETAGIGHAHEGCQVVHQIGKHSNYPKELSNIFHIIRKDFFC
ncbi:MAG: hypothetical protein WDA23_00955 [Gemmobacter sp.]